MFKKFQDFAKQSELGMAFGLILILGVMIVPISPFFMDLFIALTLAAAFMILLLSVYVNCMMVKPMEYLF